MRNLHLQHARVIRSPTVLRGIRCVHRPRKTRVDHGRAEELQAKHPSLYDEFFPKEIEQSASTEPNNNDKDIPRLPLSDLDQFGPVSHPSEDSQQPATNLTEASDKSAVKQWNLAVLVLNRVSKSLVDADFRRIAPKGRSLAEWTGPGDILKGGLLMPCYELLANSYPRTSHSRTRPNHTSAEESLFSALRQSRSGADVPKPCHEAP